MYIINDGKFSLLDFYFYKYHIQFKLYITDYCSRNLSDYTIFIWKGNKELVYSELKSKKIFKPIKLKYK